MLNRISLTSRAAAVFALSTATAAAQPVSDNLGIEDDASYARFQSAMAMSSYAMTDYALRESPRHAATVTAALVFLSINPLATEEQVTEYMALYSRDLAFYAPGDRDLSRSASFFAAVRSLDRGPSGFVSDGLDTRVSDRVLEALRVGVQTPLDFQSTQQRSVNFENARTRSFTNAPELPLILTQGLMGNDIDGNPNPFISQVIQDYLIDDGFELIPDGDGDERFENVTLALTSMPTDYTGYMAFQAAIDPMDVAASPAHAEIMGAFDGLKSNGDDLQTELAAKVAEGTSILEAAENAEDQEVVDRVLDELNQDIIQDTGYWTDLQWRTMLMLQNQRDEVRSYSTSVRSFAHVRLETNKGYATSKKATEILVGGALAFAQFKSGDVIGALGWATTAGIEFADALGIFGDAPPSAEEQIFEQLVEVRMDVENLRVEMHDRFQRLEDTLNQIQISMNASFAQIGNAIGELSDDVEDLSRAIAVSRAVLDRIEDALYSMGSDLLWADFGALVDLVLNYRNESGSDLDYIDTQTNFFAAASALRSFNVNNAANTVYAGPLVSDLTSFDDAQTVLGGSSIGRNVNDLRTFPESLPDIAQPLTGDRVVALGPWAQSATVYAQLARENPWYFAYMYENQTSTPGQADLDAIIEKGDELYTMMEAGRSELLFDELIEGYRGEINDLFLREFQVADEAGRSVYPGANIGIFSDTYTNPLLQSLIPPPQPVIEGDGALPDITFGYRVPPEDWWNLFYIGESDVTNDRDIASMLYALVTSISADAGHQAEFSYHWGVEPVPADPTNTRFVFWVEFRGDGEGIGIDPDFSLVREFVVQIHDVNDCSSYDIYPILEDSDLRYHGNVLWFRMIAGKSGNTVVYQDFSIEGYTFPPASDTRCSYEIVVDWAASGFFGPQGNAREKLDELMEYKQKQVWETLASDNTIDVEADQLLDWAALLEAYATLSMPDLLTDNDVARAALRGRAYGPVSSSDPTIVDYRDSNALRVDLEKLYEQNQLDPQNALFSFQRLGYGLEEFETALDDWLALPFPGHPYLNYTLEDLRILRDGAFKLAIDDSFETHRAGSSMSVLSNDVKQLRSQAVVNGQVVREYRQIEVDTAFGPGDPGYVGPSHGQVSINADGTFTYTPDPGYIGKDQFTYRALCDILADANGNNGGAIAYSAPAWVVFNVTESCLADVNGDGTLSPTDFTAWINAFNNALPGCDQNGDASCTPTDFTAWIANYNAGC